MDTKIGPFIDFVKETLTQSRTIRARSTALRDISRSVRSRAIAVHGASVRICRQRWSGLAWLGSGGSDDGPPGGVDRADLVECVRDAIISGKLPARTSFRSWGGPSAGAVSCAICERPIKKAELAYEVEFAEDGAAAVQTSFPLHVQCFLVWQRERKKW